MNILEKTVSGRRQPQCFAGKTISFVVTLILMCVFLYSVHKGLESLGSDVYAQETTTVVAGPTELLYPPYAEYVEQMIQFPCSAQPGFNEWRQENADLKIIQRVVSLAASDRSTTLLEERTICIITIFYKDPVREEE